ncbi:hypothetical protein ACH4A7_37380 [Streptomyces cyaneofuscatus]|uniref:hypothetical protein n=1 Tax=Streptomyces cyaneofuscatus TaxID=66883 RepID=UPI0037A37B42
MGRLRRQLADRGNVQDIDWLQVTTWALITTVHGWWPALSTGDRGKFFRRYHRLWASFTSPMPAATASTLLQMADSGQLHILRGLKDVTPAKQGFVVTAHDRTMKADVVVCAATATPAARPAAPAGAQELTDSLIRNGCAQQHPDGGLRVEPESGRLLDQGGRPQQSLHALGYLTSGTHYYMSGIPMLVWRSEAIATALATASPTSAAPASPNLLAP